MSFFRRAGALIARFFVSAADPAAAANEFKLYSKNNGVTSQLYGRSDDGTVHQITPIGGGGVPIIAAALVDGATVGGSFMSSTGFTTYLRTGPGSYQLGLAGIPPADGFCVANVTLLDAVGVPVNPSAFVSGGVVFVTLLQVPGASGIDTRFNIIVTDDR